MPFRYEKHCPRWCGFMVSGDNESALDRLMDDHEELGCSVPPMETIEVISRLSQYLRRQASMRFDEHGPYDERGAAFWDVANFLVEHPGKALADLPPKDADAVV